MSMRSVRAEIKQAMKSGRWEDKEVTQAEATRIVEEAAKGRVTKGELALVQKVVDAGIDPTGIMTMSFPELRGDAFYLDASARQVLEGFIQRYTPPSVGIPVTMAIPENPSDSGL